MVAYEAGYILLGTILYSIIRKFNFKQLIKTYLIVAGGFFLLKTIMTMLTALFLFILGFLIFIWG